MDFKKDFKRLRKNSYFAVPNLSWARPKSEFSEHLAI